MYVVHAAPVQLRFSDSPPFGKKQSMRKTREGISSVHAESVAFWGVLSRFLAFWHSVQPSQSAAPFCGDVQFGFVRSL